MPAEQTKPLNAREAASYAARLQRVVDALGSAQEAISQAEDGELWLFRKPSLEDGLRRLEAALPEIEKSVSAFNEGRPFGPDTEKGRKPTGQVSKSRSAADDQMIAEVDAELAAEAKKRAAKKKPAKRKAAGRKSKNSPG